MGLIILALFGYTLWKDHHFSKERRELLNAVLSKTSIEFATANKITEKTEPKEEVPSEYISQDSLSDEDFAKSIHKSIDEEDEKN